MWPEGRKIFYFEYLYSIKPEIVIKKKNIEYICSESKRAAPTGL